MNSAKSAEEKKIRVDEDNQFLCVLLCAPPRLITGEYSTANTVKISKSREKWVS